MGDDRSAVYRDGGDLIVFRASGFGGCARDLCAHLLGHDPLPVPADVQARFDAGNEWEPKILERLGDLGWTLDDQQTERELKVAPGVVIRSHCDALGGHQGIDAHVVEIKALADSTWTQASRKGTGTLFAYDWQMAVMMLSHKKPGVWVALNKQTDELHIEYVAEPPRRLGEIVKRAKWIVDSAKAGVMVECEDANQYPCPFLYLRPEKEKDDSAFVTAPDVDAFEQLAAEYDVLTDVVASGSAADKERKKIKEQLLQVVGEAPGALGAGWRVSKIVSERSRMVATDEKYQTVSISVEKVS